MDRVDDLARAFERFPGIGPRQAKRFVYHLLAANVNDRTRLADLIARIGVTATRQILVESEQKLLLKGFRLGDDGIDPDFLFIKP